MRLRDDHRAPRAAWMAPVVVALIMGGGLSAGPAAAQVPTLPRVDSLLHAGAYDQARAALDAWWSARDEFDVPGSDRARALMLRAQLAPDLEAAESDYLALVLGYPLSPYAPEALLRLGQGLLAAGEPARAAGYLRRLTADYPGRPEHTTGLLWLARAHTAGRHPEDACTTARRGLRETNDPDLTSLLRIEEAASCPIGSTDRPTAAAVQERGSYSAQTGAFRYLGGAQNLLSKLRSAGFEPRAVLVPANDLLRIRVGRFGTAAEAARLVGRLKDRGFDAYVVSDADQEREP